MGFFLGIEILENPLGKFEIGSEAVEKIKAILQKSISTHFKNEEGPDGPWPDLKPITWSRKKTGKMLQETGNYIKSWSVDAKQDKEVRITTTSDSDIATFHELGTKNLPVRSVAWFSDETIEEILEILEEEIEDRWE